MSIGSPCSSRAWCSLVCAAALLAGAAPAAAEDAVPSNAELYQMILELRSDQQRLAGEAENARAEAAAANEKLTATQQELATTQEQLEAAQAALAERDTPPVAAAPAAEGAEKGLIREADLGRGLSIYGEANIVRVSESQVAFATLTTEELPLLGIATNKIVQSSYETGFTLGASYAPGGPHDFAVSYQYFKNNTAARLAPPFEAPDGNEYTALIAYLAPPAFGQDAEAASAKLDIRSSSIDAEAGENLDVGEHLALRLFGGVRYSHAAEHLKAYYFGGDFPDDTGTPLDCDDDACGVSNHDWSFWGVGPRVGLGGRYHLPWGFNVFGHTAFALLVGENEAEVGFQAPQGDEIAFVHRDYGVRVFPQVDIRAGLGWEYLLSDWGTFFVDAGYEFKNYFNVVERLKFDDADAPGSFEENTTDLGIDGIFVRGGFKFNGP